LLGDTQAAFGGGVDVAAAGVDALHGVAPQSAVGGGFVGEGEPVSQGGRGGGEAEGCGCGGQKSGAEAGYKFKIFEVLPPPRGVKPRCAAAHQRLRCNAAVVLATG
jgi:hypothetical protein